MAVAVLTTDGRQLALGDTDEFWVDDQGNLFVGEQAIIRAGLWDFAYVTTIEALQEQAAALQAPAEEPAE